MTANKRIFLNIVATYGRSLFNMACGLFSARWVLMALGQEDFGLYGVVGGLVIFIGFINGLLATALSRFYAVSVGRALSLNGDLHALSECRGWFSSAVFIHSVIPIVLIVIGWPLGEHAIRAGWIAVPPSRVCSCLWAFRFSCLSCFIGMVTIPFSAMYTAKQYIAELTVYSFVTTTLNMFFFYYMMSHVGDWLSSYAAWMAAMSVLPSLIIAIRACFIFPECRIDVCQLVSWVRMRQLFCFAGWQAFGALGWVLRWHGIAILLNRHAEFGPMRNSSMQIGNQLAAQTDTLSGAMVGAFQPAIANAYGSGDVERMRSLSYCACKFGTLLSLLFVVPLALELPEVLRLWLKTPPVYAAGFCWCIMAQHIIDRTSVGHMLAVNASGRIAAYQAFLGGALILTLPLAWLLIWLNMGVYAAGWAMVATMVLCAWGRVWFARTIVGMSARYWLCKVFAPLVLLGALACAVGVLPRLAFASSLMRIFVTTLVAEIVLIAGAWKFLLGVNERQYVVARLTALKGRFSRG